MLTLLALVAAAAVPQDPQQVWTDRLSALRRPGARDGTLGPTGPRLWVGRADAAPGLRGEAHWIHHGTLARFGERLLAVGFETEDGAPLALEVQAQHWAPDHAQLEYRTAEGVRIAEHRWIECAADVFVSQFTLTGPARLRVRLDSTIATSPVGAAARFVPVRFDELAQVDPGRDRRLRSGAATDPVWVEGEDCAQQLGSLGVDRKAAASGGRVLGREWGGDVDDTATWHMAAGAPGAWELWIRYARAGAGAGEFLLEVSGHDAVPLRLAATGGWGADAAEFGFARVPFEALDDGVLAVRLTATAPGSNLNIDGLLLAPRGFDGAARLAHADLPRADPLPADPLRGAVHYERGPLTVDGVPLHLMFARDGGVRVADPSAGPIVSKGGGERLHVLALGFEAGATVRAGTQRRRLTTRGSDGRGRLVSFTVPKDAAIEVHAEGAFVIAVTRESDPPREGVVRRGHLTARGVSTAVGVGLFGVEEDELIEVPDGAERRFLATLEFAGARPLGSASAGVARAADPLAAHREQYARWFADLAPRFSCGDPQWNALWTYRWFVVRHNTAWPAAGWLDGPVHYEGRHGSWYPKVITFSAPHIVAETRWLADPTYWRGNVDALCAAQQDDGVFPNVLIDERVFRYTHWLAAASWDAFAVHPDRAAVERCIEAFARNVRGLAQRFDPDGDGLLAPGDHYATGMEFQPSFWFHQGYDDSKAATDLERPDFTSYQAANAQAVAAMARLLGRDELATEMDGYHERARAALLGKAWNETDGFFYSLRAGDDDPARCKEVIGFYPFRFGLVPDGGSFDRALRDLVDPAEFWSPFPVASAARSVPVFSAQVQRWPGPGGVVTACMWNGPTWPHADTLVADAMAEVVRHRGTAPFGAGRLGELLDRYARFHQDGERPADLLIREYGDGETGVNWGCADYFHSTWCDLVIRHLAGLVPRHDDTLEVRPLALFGPDDPRSTFRLEDLPYRGHRIGIAVDRGAVDKGRRLTVSLDGTLLGVGEAGSGMIFGGVLAEH